MQLRGWDDEIGNGAMTIGGRIAVKQMDESTGAAFMLISLNIILREISSGRQGKFNKTFKHQKVYTIK